MLLNYHIGCIVLGLLCVGFRVRFSWGGIRAVGSLPSTSTAISSPNNPLAAETHSLAWQSTRPNPTPTKLVALRTSQWTHNQPTGSDCLHSHGYVT